MRIKSHSINCNLYVNFLKCIQILINTLYLKKFNSLVFDLFFINLDLLNALTNLYLLWAITQSFSSCLFIITWKDNYRHKCTILYQQQTMFYSNQSKANSLSISSIHLLNYDKLFIGLNWQMSEPLSVLELSASCSLIELCVQWRSQNVITVYYISAISFIKHYIL